MTTIAIMPTAGPDSWWADGASAKAVTAMLLYWRVLKIQPKLSELRMIDGDHEWMTFRDALPNALQCMERQCTKLP